MPGWFARVGLRGSGSWRFSGFADQTHKRWQVGALHFLDAMESYKLCCFGMFWYILQYVFWAQALESECSNHLSNTSVVQRLVSKISRWMRLPYLNLPKPKRGSRRRPSHKLNEILFFLPVCLFLAFAMLESPQMFDSVQGIRLKESSREALTASADMAHSHQLLQKVCCVETSFIKLWRIT